MTQHFGPAKKISTFYPPQRTLMGPGPSDTHSRVLSAMARPTLGHLDPVFTDMMEELKSLLRYAFQTSNLMTFPVSGPGSVGMEMCFVNMVNPGDKVIVCRNGVFGARMIENVQRCGGTAVVVEDKWGAPVDPQKGRAGFVPVFAISSVGVAGVACRVLNGIAPGFTITRPCGARSHFARD